MRAKLFIKIRSQYCCNALLDETENERDVNLDPFRCKCKWNVLVKKMTNIKTPLFLFKLTS